MKIERYHSRHITIWFGKERVNLSAVYIPQHPAVWNIHNNGGRKPHECFDLGIRLGKIELGLTLWRIGAWSRLLRFLPNNAEMMRDTSDWGL